MQVQLAAVFQGLPQLTDPTALTAKSVENLLSVQVKVAESKPRTLTGSHGICM